jgi:mercuric ion transport protein
LPGAGPGSAWLRRAGSLGALAAFSCCIVPLVLFSLGIGGAWIGNLTALAPYKPRFVAGTVSLRKPRQACADGTARARPISHPSGEVGVMDRDELVVAAFALDYVAPWLLGS